MSRPDRAVLMLIRRGVERVLLRALGRDCEPLTLPLGWVAYG